MKPRIYAALPVARDLREPKTAERFARKAPLNWVWVAFANRAVRAKSGHIPENGE